jgi:hypothetical protein
VTVAYAIETQGAAALHPSLRPRQLRLRRRIDNFFIYRAIRRAIRDCRVSGPILMAPCGYGWYFDRFRGDGIEVVGLDLEPEAAAWARAAVSPPFPVFCGCALQMPFADGQFEFVLANRFLLHFEDGFRGRALRELARVTRRHLLVHYDTVSLHHLWRRVRGFRKPELTDEEMQDWRGAKRRERRLFYDPRLAAAEGAAAGLAVRKLYYPWYLISERVYCLYEKVSGQLLP